MASLRRLCYGLLSALGVGVFALLAVVVGSSGATIAARVGAAPALTCTPSWQVVPSPNVEAGNNYLMGVAAISAGDVWAVGYYTDTVGSQTLTEHWNGVQWSVVPSPNPGTGNQLVAVRAFAANDVWAVGNYRSPNMLLLVIHWDGTSWQQQQNPSPGYNYANWLSGVGGTSASDLWTVGFYRNYSPAGLFMHWDGAQWTVTSPQAAPYTQLYGVASVAPDNAWAVGGSWGGQQISFIYHFTGGAWQLVASPDMHMLFAIAARAADDLWAVSDSGILHGDGTSWALSSAAFPNLRSVAARTAGDVWAVGSSAVAHWDGTGWAAVPHPGLGPLAGVAALAADDVWAVGTTYNGGVAATLVEHYTSACPAATATPVPPPATATPAMPTPTPPATGTTAPPPSATPFGGTATPPATGTPARTTPTPVAPSATFVGATATATACTLGFSDVPPAAYFYAAVQYLACHGVVSGYEDGTFRPYAYTTRGQVAKIVVLAAGWPLLTPSYADFSDVPPGSPFYPYVETAYAHGILVGYADGTFRPAFNVTRGQLAKIVAGAAGWALVAPAHADFSDVPPGSPFYRYVETAYLHGALSGYADGTFRPGNPATRGQIAKIVYNAIPAPVASAANGTWRPSRSETRGQNAK